MSPEPFLKHENKVWLVASKGRSAADDRRRAALFEAEAPLPGVLRLLGGAGLPRNPSSGTQGLSDRVARTPPRRSPEARLVPGIRPTRRRSRQPEQTGPSTAQQPRTPTDSAAPRTCGQRRLLRTRSLAGAAPPRGTRVGERCREERRLVGAPVSPARPVSSLGSPLAGAGLVVSGCKRAGCGSLLLPGRRYREGSRASPGAAGSGTGETRPGPASCTGRVLRGRAPRPVWDGCCAARLRPLRRSAPLGPSLPPSFPSPPRARVAGGALRPRARPEPERRGEARGYPAFRRGAARSPSRCETRGPGAARLRRRGTSPLGASPGSTGVALGFGGAAAVLCVPAGAAPRRRAAHLHGASRHCRFTLPPLFGPSLPSTGRSRPVASRIYFGSGRCADGLLTGWVSRAWKVWWNEVVALGPGVREVLCFSGLSIC